jgi:hypothetical protein
LKIQFGVSAFLAVDLADALAKLLAFVGSQGIKIE